MATYNNELIKTNFSTISKYFIFISFVLISLLLFLPSPRANSPSSQELGCCCNREAGTIQVGDMIYGTTIESHCPVSEQVAFTNFSQVQSEGYGNCEAYCILNNPEVQQLTITVVDQNNNPIPQASVILDAGVSGYTSEDGSITFWVIPDNYTAEITKEGCYVTYEIIWEITSQPLSVVVQLDTSSCLSCECLQWSECQYNEELGSPVMTCLQASSPECELPTIPCLLPPQSTCGNGNLEYGEECETSQDCGGNPCVGCMCINENTCGNGICDEGETPQDCPIDCTSCDVETINSSIQDISITHSRGELLLNVNLPSVPDDCTFVTASLKKGENTTPIDQYTNLGFVSPGETYVDTQIQAEKTYCYLYEMKFKDDEENIFTISRRNCEYSGDEECFLPPLNERDSYCYNFDIATCDQNNRFNIEDCEEGTWCVSSGGEAQCVNNSVCDKCNSLFGNFYYIDFLVPTGSGSQVTQCSNLYQSQSPICFLSPVKSGTDAYKHCGLVSNCYDYKTKEACVENACNVDQPSGCEWVDLDSQLSLGVCRPADENLQRCEECNELENCNELLCENFGEGCYYSTTSQNRRGLCLSWWNMSCKDYDSQQDCIGSPGVNRSISTWWGWDENNDYYLLGNSTNILSPSHDRFGFGICVWQNGACYRDADNLQLVENDGYGYNDRTFSPDYYPPNTSISYDLLSELPIAVLDGSYYYIISSLDQLRSLFNVEDLRYDPNKEAYIPNTGVGGTTTYTLIVPFNIQPSELMRFKSIDEMTAEDIPSQKNPIVCSIPTIGAPLTQNKTGLYTIYYFSHDLVHNMERVKNMTFYFDFDPPVVLDNINNEIGIRQINGQSFYYTNLSFNLSICEASLNMGSSMGEVQPVTCMFNLYNISSNLFNVVINITDLQQTYSDKLSFKASYLPDALYRYSLSCWDTFGNKETETGELRLEADRRIYAPTPFFKTFRAGPITISINTTYPATCRYSNTTSNYSQMDTSHEFIDENNGLYHYAILTPDMFSDTKVYVYYTACNLTINETTGEYEIVEGDPSDYIIFAIDRQPPTTTIEILNTENITEERNITLHCNDSLDELMLGPINLAAGCSHIVYALGPCDTQPITYNSSNETTLNLTIAFEDVQSAGGDCLWYYSNDTLDNTEQIHTIKLNVTDITPPEIIEAEIG